jgi:predicted glycosyltransferase involved in capsule biosynthesis
MKNNANDYSIGVVTYINRYHTYFKKNIESLRKYFPDKQIICIINGHPDKARHLVYLKEITNWLSGLDNVKYITFEDHQSLAKCWNWILLMSSTESVLFLNDDILVKQSFRQDLENHFSKNLGFFTINNSFSHFLLSKKVVNKIGWFDERLLGIGQEDGDYLIRLAMGNVELINLPCRDIVNFVAPNSDPGFKNISSTTGGKYSSINREFMEKKWFFNHFTKDEFIPDIEFIWNTEPYKAKLKNQMETPLFYDYDLLNNESEFAPTSKSSQEKINSFKTGIKRLLNKYFNK